LEQNADRILTSDGWSSDGDVYLVDLDAYADAVARTWTRTFLADDGRTTITTLAPRPHIPPGATCRAVVGRDEDSTPDDAECYDPEDIAAWRRDEWSYAFYTVVVTLADGTEGGATLGGCELGDYWPGSTEAQIWDTMGPGSDLIGEAVATAMANTPDVSAVLATPLLEV
jgi:hypothetical protein